MNVKVTIEIDVPLLEQKIGEAMKEQKLSYEALGKKAGVTHTAIWQIVNKHNKSTKLDTLLKIAKGLDVDFSEAVREQLMMLPVFPQQ